MTWVRATGSLPITAASASLGLRPLPGLATRGVFGLAVLAAGAFLAATFLAAAFFAAGPAVLAATVLPNGVFTVPVRGGPAVLRGGNLDGANSKLTLPASASQASMAL